MRTAGNALRPSTARRDATVINNFPGLYATDDWAVCYWDMQPDGSMREHGVTVQLPVGLSSVCVPISVGYNGCIQHVRRWGFSLYPSLLEDIEFDVRPLLGAAPDEQEGGRWLQAMLRVTHFDLPGEFIIASAAHPFRLYSPDGTLRGSYTRWFTQVGALAYQVSQGHVYASFLGLESEDSLLYQQALGYLQQALGAQQQEQRLTP